MGQIKNIKLHIVTDIKVQLRKKMQYFPCINFSSKGMALGRAEEVDDKDGTLGTGISGGTN